LPQPNPGADLDIRAPARQVAGITPFPVARSPRLAPLARQDPMPQTPIPARDPLLPLATFFLLVWHLALAGDYLNARFIMDDSLPQLTAALALPQIWATVGWGMAVWTGLAAALFLLWRDDAAVLLLFAAGVSAALAAAGDILAGGAGAILSLPRFVVLGAVIAVPVLGWLYGRARHASGHLT